MGYYADLGCTRLCRLFVLQWGVFSLFGGHMMSLRPALISAALTGFLFPLMAGAFHTFGRIRPGRDRPG